jgi:hypothetical protein
MSETFEGCTDAQELASGVANLSVFKSALKALQGGWKGSAAELNKVLKSTQASIEQSEHIKKRNPVAGAVKSQQVAKVGATWEVIQTRGSEIISLDCSSPNHAEEKTAHAIFGQETLSEMAPYVVRNVNLDFMKGTGPVGLSLAEFTKEFVASDARRTHKRAMRKNMDSSGDETYANDFALANLLPHAPPGAILSPAMPRESALRNVAALSNFGIKGGSTHCANEKESLWTMRLTTQGTRMIAVCNHADIVKHMKKEGIVGMQAKDYLRDLKQEGMNKIFENGFQMQHTTVGKGDLLWLPAHALVLESVLGQDTFGMRAAMVVPRDSEGMDAFAAVAGRVTTPSGHLSKAVVQLATKPPAS